MALDQNSTMPKFREGVLRDLNGKNYWFQNQPIENQKLNNIFKNQSRIDQLGVEQ